MEKLNLAIIGYGGMGGWHGTRALKSDVVNLLGIYDIAPDRCALATERNIYVYPSLEAVLNDPRVDMVTIATPNDLHKDIAVQALDAGKHVICEKPVALSVAELDEMIAASKRNNRLFTVHQNRRWDTDYLVIKQLVENGDIGDMINVESRVQGSRGIPGDWRGKKQYGGGMLLDWGIHLIDQIMQMIPEKVIDVYCTFDHITNVEVDDGFKLTLTFESGKTAFVEVGTYNFLSLPRWYLRCTNGAALVQDWKTDCDIAKCKYLHEDGVVPVQTAAGLTKTMAPRNEHTVETYQMPQPSADVHDFYRNVCKAVRGEAEQLVTHAQLRRVMQVIETAFLSVEKETKMACDI